MKARIIFMGLILASCAREAELVKVSFGAQVMGESMTRVANGDDVRDYVSGNTRTTDIPLLLRCGENEYETKTGCTLTLPVGTYHVSGGWKDKVDTYVSQGCYFTAVPETRIDTNAEIHSYIGSYSLPLLYDCIGLVVEPSECVGLTCDGVPVTMYGDDFWIVFMHLDSGIHTMSLTAREDTDATDTDIDISLGDWETAHKVENGYFYRLRLATADMTGGIDVVKSTMEEGEL